MNIEQWLDETIVDYGIATQEEVDLVCAINGYNEEALLDIVYVRTGLRSVEQLCDDLGIDNPLEEDDEDEDEE